MTHTRLSIVIPTKNESKYIGQTLAQFNGYLEKYGLKIIVSDAGSTGSTDGTAEIVQRYQADTAGRIRLVQTTGKQNIAIGRNVGAAHATGDILFHMDADVHIPELDRFFQLVLAKFERPGVVAATVPIWMYPQESKLNDCLVAGEDCNLFYRLHKEGRIAYFTPVGAPFAPPLPAAWLHAGQLDLFAGGLVAAVPGPVIRGRVDAGAVKKQKAIGKRQRYSPSFSSNQKSSVGRCERSMRATDVRYQLA